LIVFWIRIALALFGAFGALGTAGVFDLTGRGFGFDFALVVGGAGVSAVTGMMGSVGDVAGIEGIAGIGIGVAGIDGVDELEGVCRKVPETPATLELSLRGFFTLVFNVRTNQSKSGCATYLRNKGSWWDLGCVDDWLGGQ
jgi:hypothetical protein